MGRKRATVIIDRKQFEDYALDKITTKVKEVSVWQGVFEGVDEFAFVQKSRYKDRQPSEVNIWAHTIRGAERGYVMHVYDARPNEKWCSHCGDWVNKNGFSPKKDASDGLHPICKTCRAEHSRGIYWQRKLAA